MSYTLGPDHFMSAFVEDKQVQELFGVSADMSAMIAFEKALTLALDRWGLTPLDHAQQITDVLDTFTPDMDAIYSAYKRDGITPPSLVNQVRAQLNDDCKSSFHFGATSQDLVDTSLMMRMRDSVAIVAKNLQTLSLQLNELASSHSNERVLSARTRMQNALPISVPEKIGNWQSQIEGMLDSTPQTFLLQLGGPEGAARKFGAAYHDIVNDMSITLDLTPAKHVWHTDRRPVTSIAFWFSQVSTVMGKISLDVLLMVQSDVGEVSLKGGGSSSAMQHKKNPVLAEVILAQAGYCHTQFSPNEKGSRS